MGNTIDKTEGYGVMVGLGANNAPSENVTVAENVVRSPNLVRLGRYRPGLRMDRNRYAKGGLLKAASPSRPARLAPALRATPVLGVLSPKHPQ